MTPRELSRAVREANAGASSGRRRTAGPDRDFRERAAVSFNRAEQRETFMRRVGR